MKSNVLNLTQKISGKAYSKSPEFLYNLHVNNKLYYDRERLQRLLVRWHDAKVNSYLFTAFNGASVKDCFQLAAIAPIVEELKQQLIPTAANFRFIEENLAYFQSLLDLGFEYLVLDGQHRIDTYDRFFSSEYYFKPEETISMQIEGEKGVIDIEGTFDKLPEEIQFHLKNAIPLIVVVYETGDLRELARIFITSNSMMPMTKHEKRILNYNPTNRWLNNICLNDINVKDMFNNIGSGMTGEYSLDHKGDTLFVAEMLMYICNNMYDGYDTDVLDNILGSYPKGKLRVTDADKEITRKILRVMADGCSQYDAKKLSKFTKSSFYNMFYTLSFFMQKGNVWGKKKEIDGSFKVVDDALFVQWFLDEEFKRINAQGTKVPYKNATGKTKYQIHDWSFAKHNADQKHARKESVKGDGGSKYTFDSWARVQYLLEDLNSALTMLKNRSIIAPVGSRDTMTRDEALVALDVPLSLSDEIEINEIVPVSKGGKRVIGNIEALPKDKNRTQSDRVRRVA